MLLTFFWKRFGGLRPYCDSDAPEGYPNALACLLMDDGGGGPSSSLECIDVGLASAAAVLAGQSATTDWDRDYWGATIDREHCRAYSLLDESYGETLATPAFQSILLHWRAFIAVPDETCMAREQHNYVPLPG